jgi:hypothetical protein
LFPILPAVNDFAAGLFSVFHLYSQEGFPMNNKFTDNSPAKLMPRFVQVDDWIFEVKTVRALRVDQYGKPYTAIANLTVNGDTAYLDGLLTRETEQFSRKDFETFYKFGQQMKVKEVHFDRFKNDESVAESIKIQPIKSKTMLKLVR